MDTKKGHFIVCRFLNCLKTTHVIILSQCYYNIYHSCVSYGEGQFVFGRAPLIPLQMLQKHKWENILMYSSYSCGKSCYKNYICLPGLYFKEPTYPYTSRACMIVIPIYCNYIFCRNTNIHT